MTKPTREEFIGILIGLCPSIEPSIKYAALALPEASREVANYCFIEELYLMNRYVSMCEMLRFQLKYLNQYGYFDFSEEF